MLKQEKNEKITTKIVDFGLIKSFISSEDTELNSCTPNYSAPEML